MLRCESVNNNIMWDGVELNFTDAIIKHFFCKKAFTKVIGINILKSDNVIKKIMYPLSIVSKEFFGRCLRFIVLILKFWQLVPIVFSTPDLCGLGSKPFK